MDAGADAVLVTLEAIRGAGAALHQQLDLDHGGVHVEVRWAVHHQVACVGTEHLEANVPAAGLRVGDHFGHFLCFQAVGQPEKNAMFLSLK